MNNIKNMVKKSGTSFFWSMRLLPRSRRNAMYTIYALFRHLDDIVDGNESMEEKLELIGDWREEMDNIFDKKQPSTDIGRRIYKNCIRFNLPKEEFIRMIDSLAMDLPLPIQAPSLEDFKRYCRGVAGVPGNLSLRIFGCKDEKQIEKLATVLGTALQITNILRDVKEDALSQRLYIPEEFLNTAGIASRDPMTVIVDKNLAIAREELAKMAEEYYRDAFNQLKKFDKNVARPVKAIAYIYKRYFDIMQNRGWEVISPKPKIGKFIKLCLTLKAFVGK